MYQNKLVMPKINNKDIYNQDDTLSMNDFLIGSNSNTGNKKTQTYSLGSIFSLFYNFLGNNAFLNTTDTTTYPIGTPGCFYVFDENGNFTSDFSEANKITFSQYDTYNFDTVNYFSIIVNSGKFLFKLINLENKNNFVFLKPSNFVLSETGTTFDVNVVLEQGLSNGSFVNYKRYLLVLEFAAGNFDPADYDLSDFLNESENPFITEQDLTNALSLLTTPITDHSGLNLDDGTNPHGTTIDDVAKAGNITEEFIQFGEISTSQIQLRKDSNYVALKAENLTEDRELFAPDENGTIATKEWVSFYFTTALIGYATQAWVTSQGYITNVITALGYTPENVDNKSTSVVADQASNTKYPSVKSVYDWVVGLLSSKLDKVTTGSVRRVYAVDTSNNQEMIPVSDLKEVLEYANLSAFPATGETGKIYVDLSTNLQYRWSGTIYISFSAKEKVIFYNRSTWTFPNVAGAPFPLISSTNFELSTANLNSTTDNALTAMNNISPVFVPIGIAPFPMKLKHIILEGRQTFASWQGFDLRCVIGSNRTVQINTSAYSHLDSQVVEDFSHSTATPVGMANLFVNRAVTSNVVVPQNHGVILMMSYSRTGIAISPVISTYLEFERE